MGVGAVRKGYSARPVLSSCSTTACPYFGRSYELVRRYPITRTQIRTSPSLFVRNLVHLTEAASVLLPIGTPVLELSDDNGCDLKVFQHTGKA